MTARLAAGASPPRAGAERTEVAPGSGGDATREPHPSAWHRTVFVWDGDVLLGESDRPSEDPLSAVYVYEPGTFRPLAVARRDGYGAGAAVYRYHLDHLGTPQELTDAAGAVAWAARYDAWGAGGGGGFAQPLRFPGQYADAETGLHYNRHRYYSPAEARFTAQDPIRLDGGVNLGMYAPNPVQWADPLGLANYPTNVDFTGHPDLFPVTGDQKNIVEITMQGSRTRDFTESFKAAGISRTDASGYTWHHVHDFDPNTGRTTMQLVKTPTHEAALPHKGSAAQFAEHFGVEYDSPEAVRAAEGRGWLKGRKPKVPSGPCAF